MSDYGMKPEGFILKRLQDIRASLEAAARLALGSDATLAPDSIEGQMISTFSTEFTDLWEQTNNGYDAFNPAMVSGATLDHVCSLNGVIRQDDVYSYVDVTCTGIAGTVIIAGSTVGTTNSGVRFYLDEDLTFDDGGVAIGRATADIAGSLNASAGTVTRILSPVNNWDTVTNAADAVPGRSRETDEALRVRREKSLALSGVSTIEALYSIIANIEGVSHSRVYENYTNVTDSNGLPAHSFACVVRGGEDTDIGAGIWSRKPSGILSFGNTSVDITDIQGMQHSLDFVRPVDVPVWVEVVIEVFDTANFPSDYEELIQQAVIDYAEGNLVSGAGFDVSDDVVNSRVYTPVNLAVQGHTINTLEMSIDGVAFDATDIPIGIFEVSLFEADKITVTIV